MSILFDWCQYCNTVKACTVLISKIPPANFPLLHSTVKIIYYKYPGGTYLQNKSTVLVRLYLYTLHPVKWSCQGCSRVAEWLGELCASRSTFIMIHRWHVCFDCLLPLTTNFFENIPCLSNASHLALSWDLLTWLFNSPLQITSTIYVALALLVLDMVLSSLLQSSTSWPQHGLVFYPPRHCVLFFWRQPSIWPRCSLLMLVVCSVWMLLPEMMQIQSILFRTTFGLATVRVGRFGHSWDWPCIAGFHYLTVCCTWTVFHFFGTDICAFDLPTKDPMKP